MSKIKNGHDVDKVLDRAGLPHRRSNGSHAVGTLPNGTKLAYHYHGEYGKGIAHKIEKTLKQAGVLLFLLVFAFSFNWLTIHFASQNAFQFLQSAF